MSVDQLRPKSLDDIIRFNRDEARLYMSTAAELHALGSSRPPRAPRAVIAEGAFITMYFANPGVAMVYLTGLNETEHCSWMTSEVMAINGDAVFTRSGSCYRLRGRRSDRPDLLHICATLHLWGVGRRFGVPNIFY